MNSISQSMRPRHQVLTLKCYPRFQKNAVEVKPNASELSYLLYYASTRRSKLRKVGAFLEKKTESDVWRLRSGYVSSMLRPRRLGATTDPPSRSNVLVTLQILEALIDKCGRDLPLFSSNALRILEIILSAQEVSLIEESVAAFHAFCVQYDTAQMSGDHEHRAQYDRILSLYASYASKSQPPKLKTPPSIPVSMRYRTAGLKAIKALVASPSFTEDDGYHCKTIIPVVLDNLVSGRQNYLLVLQKRHDERLEKEKMPQHRRRQSQNLSRATISLDDDPTAAAGTTEDVDQRAEEEVGLLALQTLQAIFSGDTRAHLRSATAHALAFSKAYDRGRLEGSQKEEMPGHGTWGCQLFELMCRSTAVQDRFIILVTAMEGLIRSPIVETDLDNQLVLTRIVRWLLRSSVNFIGLSIIDVLVSMIQHILLLLQLGGEGSQIRPHSLKPDALHSHPTDSDGQVATSSSGKTDQVPLVMEVVKTASATRMQLLDELQQCTGDLATHVYYSDQIGDMVTALLLRLKPSPAPGVENPAAAIENPVGAAEAIADSVSLQQKPNTDGYFSFDTARLLALAAVRDIIQVANSRRADGYDAAARNRVSISVWDGTQWLLRDPDVRVRGAYIEALLTWLRFETTKLDLRATTYPVRRGRTNTADTAGTRLGETTRRALSNASRRSPGRGRHTSNFLQLLNMAVFDSAVEFCDAEPDVLMLHLLNHALIDKLGVNSVRHSLPMIYALQDEVVAQASPAAKINLGSLVHGYFWALSDFFGFDTTFVGRAIFDEVTRRSQNAAWLPEVYVPPMSFERIPALESFAAERQQRALPTDLRPLGYRKEIVDNIEDHYSGTILSPPSSPPASPGRPNILPALNVASFTGPGPVDRALPDSFKEALLTTWTREDVIALAEQETTRTASLSRSKAGSAHGRAAGGLFVDQSGMTSRSDVSIAKAESLAAPGTADRRLTSPGGSSRNLALSSPSGRSVVRVSHLKSVLAGGNDYRSSLSKSYRVDDDDDEGDTASESMMSADFSNESFLGDSLARLSTREESTSIPSSTAPRGGDRSLVPDSDIPAVPLVPPELASLDSSIHSAVLGAPLGAADKTTPRMSTRAEKPSVSLDQLLDGLTAGNGSAAKRPGTSRGMGLGVAPPY